MQMEGTVRRSNLVALALVCLFMAMLAETVLAAEKAKTGPDSRQPAASKLVRFELRADATTRTEIPETVTLAIERNRAVVNRDSHNEAARQKLAQAAVDLAQLIFEADAVENAALRHAAEAYLELTLSDTGWRLGQMATHNNAQAQAALGLFHALGVVVAKDKEKSCAYYVDAARRSNPAAMFYAVFCVQGTDAAQAGAWLRAAAEAGHPVAQELIARACLEAEPPDLVCASQWLESAANSGRPSAMALMGWLASKTDKDDPRAAEHAIDWYTRAALHGNAVAQNNLAEIFERGRGVPADPAKAVTLYRQAAESGFPAAQYNLGRLYWTGVGVGLDRAMAELWLNKAAGNGIAQAKALLESGQPAR
jgi:TPR repeat protein